MEIRQGRHVNHVRSVVNGQVANGLFTAVDECRNKSCRKAIFSPGPRWPWLCWGEGAKGQPFSQGQISYSCHSPSRVGPRRGAIYKCYIRSFVQGGGGGGAGIAQWLERRTRDWKVAGSNPCWNGGRIFFSRVDFLFWLLFRYPFHPRVTTVARKKSRSFCQKCRWQVTTKTRIHLKPVRMLRMFVRPNILRTLRRTMIRFLIEHLVRRIWFGQSKLYFILSWLVMRCSFGPNLRQTRSRQHDQKCRLKSSQYTLIIPHQGNSTNYYLILGLLRQGCAFHKSTNKQIPSRSEWRT